MAGEYIPPWIRLYLTPNEIPLGVFCRQFNVPDNPTWNALMDGALTPLMEADAWRKLGALEPEECAERWREMLYESWAAVSCVTGVPTPFWDSDSEVDDELPADTQTWYGYVTNPEAAQSEFTFFENALIWSFTGFIALATLEVGAAPAILFNTVAKKMVIANRRGDVGEIIRIWIDGGMAAEVDTSGYASGDVIRTSIVGDASLETHSIAIVQVS